MSPRWRACTAGREASGTALETLYRQFLRDVCGRLALPPDVNLERLAEVAARRGQTDKERLRRLLATCELRLDAGKSVGSRTAGFDPADGAHQKGHRHCLKTKQRKKHEHRRTDADSDRKPRAARPSWEAPSVNFFTPPPVETAATPSYQAAGGEVQRVAQAITAEVHKAVVGQDETIENALAGLFADGHVLLEGVPGTAKTLLVRALAAAVSGEFKRIQFTPGLDALGHHRHAHLRPAGDGVCLQARPALYGPAAGR